MTPDFAVPRSAVVITLRRSDRLERFMADWAGTGPDLPLAVHYGAEMDDPVAGCYRSHVEVLAAADGPLLVLEDDAVFASGAPELDVIDVPSAADLLYYGGEHRTPPWRTAPGMVRGTIRRTHAYVARDPNCVARLLKVGCGSGHVDYALSGLALRSYAVKPFFVGQRAGPSLVTGRMRLRDQYWN